MSRVSSALDRRAKDQRGFTLIELLVVVIIIGILAAVSVPIFLNQRKKAWDATAIADLKNAQLVMETDLVAHPQNTAVDPMATADAVGKSGQSGSCPGIRGTGAGTAENYFSVTDGNCIALAADPSKPLEYILYSCSTHNTGNCYMYDNTASDGITRIKPSEFASKVNYQWSVWVYTA